MTQDFTKTSGDMQADRRYGIAQQLAQEGDARGAIDLLLQTADIVPRWPAIPFMLGTLYADSGEKDKALECYARALALDPLDALGARLKISLLTGAAQTQMPPAFIEKLFDQYAPRFDAHLTGSLSYDVPRQIAEIVRGRRAAFARILDLGCGTGLGAAPFAGDGAWIEGVDLSGAMLDIAGNKNLYSRLHKADIAAWLAQPCGAPFDLIIAADVFTYCGPLETLCAGVSAHLVPGGLFAFSVQKGDEDFRLEESRRFSHSADYILRCLAAAGLGLLSCEKSVLRKDRDQDVNGFIVLAEKNLQAGL